LIFIFLIKVFQIILHNNRLLILHRFGSVILPYKLLK